MGALALRRTKATPGIGGRPLVELPPKTTLIVEARTESSPPPGIALPALSHHWPPLPHLLHKDACNDPLHHHQTKQIQQRQQVDLGPDDAAAYERLEAETRAFARQSLEAAGDAGLLRDHSAILTLLLRLRQVRMCACAAACCWGGRGVLIVLIDAP